MIKAICFDLDGVYFLNGKSNFIKALGELGVSESEAKRVFLQSDQMNQQYKLGVMSDEDYWDWAINEWKLSLSRNEVIDLLIQGYEVNDSAAKYVQTLHKAGYKTLICTNNFPARINGLQKRFGFLNDFDTVVLSYEVGVLKPELKIFQALVEKSGVKADEIFYSDDDETKMIGAKELGIQTFLYTDFDGFKNELVRLGVSV